MALTADIMPAIGDWLKSTRLTELSVWIGNTPLSTALNQNNWITPTLQSIHILAIAITFSAALMISLRIAGLAGQSRTLPEVAQRYLPWIWGGLLTLLVTGFVLLLAEPGRQLLNPYFWTKMMLVVIAVLSVFGFQRSIERGAGIWAPTAAHFGALRFGAVALIGVWAAIMVMGRWIAYGV
ncbi:MAG: DUF6644 family protein [Caulobacteraceae bacterium]